MTLLSRVVTLPGRNRGMVIAHELGHQARKHGAKNTLLIFLLGGFSVVAFVWAGMGQTGYASNARHVPVPYLLVIFVALATAPIQARISRRFEREADQFSLELTQDPESFIATLRYLAHDRLTSGPLGPVTFGASHPPVQDRIAMAQLWLDSMSSDGPESS